MKVKFLAIILFFVWIFQLSFTLLCFFIAKHNCYSEFIKSKHKIDSRFIQSFIFANERSINWEKRDKEFEYKGNYYDVITLKIINGAVFIKCISDETEDALKTSFLNDALNKQKQASNKAKLQIDEFVLVQMHEYIPRNLVRKIFEDYQYQFYGNVILDNDVPPPELGQFKNQS